MDNATLLPAELVEHLCRIVLEAHWVFLGVSEWVCHRPWQVPERRINDNFMLMVIDGAEKVTCGGREKILHRGEAMFVPEFHPHSFQLAPRCKESRHFIAHVRCGTTRDFNWFSGFMSPFVKLRQPGYYLAAIHRVAAMRSCSEKAAMITMRRLFFELLLDCTERGLYRMHNQQVYSVRIMEAIEFIQSNYTKRLTIAEIARFIGLGEVRFRTEFQREVGMPPSAYLLRVRLDYATRLLVRYDYGLDEIAEQCGFHSTGYFCTAFRHIYQCSPGEFRKSFQTV